jgi:3-oxoadipate enol-lactonase
VPAVAGEQPMPVASLSSASLYYELHEPDGVADPVRVLVIPGTGSDLREAPGPFGWPGAERFAVLSYDHRGLGRSRAAGERPATMEDFAADALELADQVGWDAFAVVGISFGGMVAQELALRAPGRVAKLVLAITSAGGALGASYPLHELYALPAEERLELLVSLLDTRTTEDAELAAALHAFLAANHSLHPARVPAGLARQLDARSRHDASARLAELTMPCLVAAGRHDGIAPPERSAALAAAIPGARLAIFDGGHGVLLQDPAAWPMIAAFLAR